MDYESFLSDYGRRSHPNILRELIRFVPKDGSKVIYLAGGVPSPNTFPIESFKIKLKDGTEIEINEQETGEALQYNLPEGHKPLLEELEKRAIKYHDPPSMNKRRVILCSGAQDAINKALQIMINPGEGVIVPSPIYNGTLSSLKCLNAHTIGIEEDSNGMIIESLRNTLQDSSRRIKILYVNPNSCNPSGMTYTLQRRREIYQLAREFNLIILEDDAYYFLHFTKSRPPSFLSLDEDGRVIRVESFSKFFSPGIRLGSVVGPKPLLDRIEWLSHISIQQPSTVSQMIIYKTLLAWGEKGFENHIKKIQEYYLNQAKSVMESAKRWLTGLAEWVAPDGGFFLWLKIPGIKDSNELICQRLMKKGIVFVAGRYFLSPDKDSPCIRMSYSFASRADIDKAFMELAQVIVEVKNMTNNHVQ